MYKRWELDCLICHDPAAYVELIVEGNPKRYLQAVTRYELPEEMKQTAKEALHVQGFFFQLMKT